MEITSFVLGMLTIIGMAVAVLVVLGIVKIYKQSKKVEQLENTMYKEFEHIHRITSDTSNNLDTRIELHLKDLNQEMYYIRQDLNQRIDRIEEHIFKSIEEEKREIISYVDSRIDKLQSKKEANK